MVNQVNAELFFCTLKLKMNFYHKKGIIMKLKFNKLSVLILLPLILIPTSVFSEGMKCIGMDGKGKTENIIVNVHSNTININGRTINVIAGGKNGESILTENYNSDKGGKVKSILDHSANSMGVVGLTTINVKTNRIIEKISLVCSES